MIILLYLKQEPRLKELNYNNKGEYNMNKKTNTERYEALQKQLLKACFNGKTPATNNRVINKIAAQLRYLERV